MKHSIDVLVVFFCAAFALLSQAQSWDQEWRMKKSSEAGKVHFAIERSRPGSRWNHSSDMPVEHFQGLSLQALSNGGPAKFQFVRDAGRLLCEGQFTMGRGIGSFEFKANPQYSTELQRLGYEEPQENQLFSMLMADVSLEFARGVKQANVPSTTKQLLDMRIHGVTLDYIQRMRAGGYTTLDARNYIDMRIHGVTPELVAELKKAGYDIPASKVVEMKIHGVSPDYIRALNSFGLRPDASEVVQMRIHGVSPEYLKTLKDSGHADLDVRQVVNMRIHNVSPEFVQESRKLGYSFTSKELTELRIHGVNTAYLQKLKDSGYQNLGADKIVKLRIHGVQ
jgi:hypothetical protein